MVERCRTTVDADQSETHVVTVIKADIRDIKIENASMVGHELHTAISSHC